MGKGNKSSTESHVDSQFTSLIGNISEFDPRTNDWDVFLRRLKQFFIANCIAEERRSAVLLSLLNENAFKLIQDLCLPDDPENKSFEELAEKFSSHFYPPTKVFMERDSFYKCSRNLNESISDWAARIRNLATNCKFGSYLEDAMRDKFVTGLFEGSAKTRLYREDENLTFAEAMSLALAAETAQPDSLQDRKSATTEVFKLHKQQENPKQHNSKHQFQRHPQQQQRQNPVRQQITEERRSNAAKSPASTACSICGYSNHTRNNCKYKNYSCNNCGKKGHLSQVCRNKFSQNYLDVDDLKVFHIMNHKNNNVNDFSVDVILNGKPFKFQVDTGATISVCSKQFWLTYFKSIPLNSTNALLTTYNGANISPIGYIKLNVQFNKKTKQLEFYVVETKNKPLLGLNWIKAFNVKCQFINAIQVNEKNNLIEQYKELFSNSVGKFSGEKIKFKIKNDAIPKSFNPRPVPYALKEKIERELYRLTQLKIISPIEYSAWSTPVVPVLKKDGSVRLCGDYKVTINKVIEPDRHPIPRIEDIFAQLQGGKQFTKLDLSQAYNQIELDDESKLLTTISTHKGLFKYERLPFGISSAPGKFQRIMEKLLMGLKGVTVFFDDIVITGRDQIEHLRNVQKVFERLQKGGFRINLKKCQFFQDEVEYLGYTINQEGLKMSQNKIESVKKMSPPTDQVTLKSFIGFINYYRRFIKDFSAILKPLYELTKPNVPWLWNKQCNQAFLTVKDKILNSSILVHFNPNIPVRLTVDASPYGLGAILSHIYPDGSERPISFASRTLSNAEKNYSQLDKESTAIVFGVHKFNQYVYGRYFEIYTDHKPLVSVFKKTAGIPQHAANRLQRHAIFLAGYDFDIKYIKSELNNADYFSRIPLKSKSSTDDDVDEVYLNFIKENESPVTINDIKKETNRDKTLSKVKEFLLNGWPKETPENIKAYKLIKNELTLLNNCVCWGQRVVVPLSLQQVILTDLHRTHMGMVRMKQKARSYFWWPGITKDIENRVKSCESCLNVKDSPPKCELIPWKWPTQPWSRVHCDFAGPIDGKYFLIVTDAHSKWIEVVLMNNITANSTVATLRTIFSKFGLPNIIVSDNGTQFTSELFQIFLKQNGIVHLKSSVNHPATNGAAENAVRTFKNGLFKALYKNKNADLNLIINNLLLDYRTTPHATTGVSPAKLMFGRELRTRFDLLKENDTNNPLPPTEVAMHVKKMQNSQILNYGGKRKVNFEIDEICMVRDYRNNKPSWTKAKIAQKIGQRHFIVQVGDNNWKRHIDQIRKCITEQCNSEVSEQTTVKDNNKVDLPRNRPKRIIRPPKRYC